MAPGLGSRPFGRGNKWHTRGVADVFVFNVLSLLPSWRRPSWSNPGNCLHGRRLDFVAKGMQKERLGQCSVIDTQNRVMHQGNSFVSQAIVSGRISKFLYLLH